MAVSTDNAYSGPYAANGVTTVYPFTFTANTADDVAVLVRDASGAQVASGSYFVTVNSGAGGSITFTVPPVIGCTVVPLLDPSFTQDIEFENGSSWSAEPVNEGYDRSALRDQMLKRDISRGMLVPLGELGSTLPAAIERATKALFFDESGAPNAISIDDFAAPAKGAAAQAGNSAASAEAAAGPTYATISAGLAATASGQAFAVSNGNGTVTVYLNSSGTAVAQRTLATTAYLASASGASAIGVPGGGTLDQKIPPGQKYAPAGGSVEIFIRDILDRYLFPEQFGAAGNGTLDDSSAWQEALNRSASARKAIYFPNGESVVDNITLRRAKIEGRGRAASVFKAKAGSTNPLFNLPVGQVQGFNIVDVDIQGLFAANPGQGCLRLISQSDGSNGGIWTSNFANIEIRGFDGRTIDIRGGTTTFDRPQQWAKFTKVQIERARKESGFALYASGQVEGVTFDTCRFDGNGSGTYVSGATDQGTNIYLGREWSGGTPFSGSALGDNAPDELTFLNCVIQQASQGVIVDRAENIDFTRCRFEDLGGGIHAVNSAIVSILGGRFGDAGNITSLTTAAQGRVIMADAAARITAGGGMRALGTFTRALDAGSSGSLHIWGANPGFEGAGSSNVFPTMSLASGATSIILRHSRGALVSASVAGIVINSLVSDLSPGECLLLLIGGSNPFTLSTVGGSFPSNFNLGSGVTSATMTPGETYMLMRSAVGRGFHLFPKIA